MEQLSYSLEEIIQAYYDCRKNKRNTINAVKFEQNLEKNLIKLWENINSKEYEIGKSVCFIITNPKFREVWAASFRDRIVHHLIYNRIEKYFRNRFIYDSYACVPEKGVIFGANRIHKFIRSSTQDWTYPSYFLQVDLKNFFTTIDKNILISLFDKHIQNTDNYWLLKKIIFNDPTENYFCKSSNEMFTNIPKDKSLFHTKENKGLPIGNLSSQFFANIYLNELDQFIKRNLKIKYYGRYVDDLVLIHNNIDYLNYCYEQICSFVEENLFLKFNEKKTNFGSVYNGIDFCGMILKPYRKYLRRRTINSLKETICSKEKYQNFNLWQSRINSYFGFAKHTNSFNFRKNLLLNTGHTTNININKIVKL